MDVIVKLSKLGGTEGEDFADQLLKKTLVREFLLVVLL